MPTACFLSFLLLQLTLDSRLVRAKVDHMLAALKKCRSIYNHDFYCYQLTVSGDQCDFSSGATCEVCARCSFKHLAVVRTVRRATTM